MKHRIEVVEVQGSPKWRAALFVEGDEPGLLCVGEGETEPEALDDLERRLRPFWKRMFAELASLRSPEPRRDS